MVLLIFLIPIGVIVYIYERRVFKENRAILNGYIKMEISDNSSLTNLQKIEKTQALLDKNGYKVVQKDDKSIVGEKKIFSIGLLFIGVFIFYLLYYFFFQKPDRLEFRS
jgi:hypothetical protein